MNIILDSDYYKYWYDNVNLSKSSKKAYKCELKRFGEYLMIKGAESNLDFDNFYFIEESETYEPIDEEIFDEYLEFLIEGGSSSQMLYHAISFVKSFFRFIKSVGMIKENPLKYYKNPYYRIIHRDYTISKEECMKILNAAYKYDPFTKKYYVLVLLLLTCGLRKSELLMLRKSQISFEFNQIEITRGQKTSAGVVVMTDLLKRELKAYLEHPAWDKWSQGRDKEVFFEGIKPLNQNNLPIIMNEIYKIAGITRRIRLHDYRHTMAYLMYSAGINVMTIKQQLRHERLATTIHYLPPGEELAKILEMNANNQVK